MGVACWSLLRRYRKTKTVAVASVVQAPSMAVTKTK